MSIKTQLISESSTCSGCEDSFSVRADVLADDTVIDDAAPPNALIHSAELNYINRCHTYPQTSFNPAATSGLFARLSGRFKAWLLALIKEHLLKEYFESETEFQANLVRTLNDISRAIDTRDWRIDDEYRASLHALEKRVSDAVQTLRAEANKRLSDTDISLAQHNEQLATLDSVARGLERIVSGLGREAAPAQGASSESDSAQSQNTAVDYSYILLENRFRGTEDEVAKRLAIYPKLFQEMPAPVLEIGSGRGELQLLFREQGIECYGTELDRAMVKRCQEQGLNVQLENGLDHLTCLADASLGGIIAVQVIEHLDQQQLSRLLQLCRTKVKKGGRVVFETINTESVSALSHNYFRDPTHALPLHPQTMSYLMELAGLRVLEVKKLSPLPKEARLQQLVVEDYMTPRWAAAIELLNYNFEKLNELLYGPQDYCVIAEV